MKKLIANLIAVNLTLLVFAGFSFAQKNADKKYGKISEMIGASQKIGGLFSGLLGEMPPGGETTNLSAVNFPNSVKVKYSGETRKISKARKKAVDKWLKDYAKTDGEKKFYANEISVEEDGKRYWIMAHENNVLGKLKSAVQKTGEIVLKLKILGYYQKGDNTDYFLLADAVE